MRNILLFSVSAILFALLGTLLVSCARERESLPVANAPPTTPTLPPDPGEAGQATVEGVDSDRDGLRDDIQRYVELTHSDSAKTRAALTQFARVGQQFLLDANNEQASIGNAREEGRARACLYYVRPSDATTLESELLSLIVNTDARHRAYLEADAHLGGQVFTIYRPEEMKSQCAFDPDRLPN